MHDNDDVTLTLRLSVAWIKQCLRLIVVNTISPYATSPCNECAPVRTSAVRACMLTKSDFTICQCGAHQWEIFRSKIFFTQQLIYRAGMYTRKEHSSCINPLPFDLRRTHTDKQGSWSAQRYQLMRINRQIACIEFTTILDKITREPMVFSRRT